MYENMRASEQGDNAQIVIIFRSGDTPDPRRYNEPSGRDVAAIFTGETAAPPRHLCVRPVEHGPRRYDARYLNEHVYPMTCLILSLPENDVGVPNCM